MFKKKFGIKYMCQVFENAEYFLFVFFYYY